MIWTVFVAILAPVASHAYGWSSETHLRIVHTNDIHAHLDEFNNKNGLDCKPEDIASGICVGGIARIRTIVDRLRTASRNTLFFDAGDQFQGTMFYSFFKGEKIAEFMNDIKYDLMCIGNHEFDDGEQAMYNFFRNLTFPVVSSNIDLATTRYIKDIVKPYTVIEKNGLKVGVIGYITAATKSITKGAFNITFLDPVQTVQRAVNELHQKGIRKIICVSHTGYAEDMQLAQKTYGINLIIGGHSHSLLLKDQSGRGVEGPYPTPVVNLANQTTYIVQAHRWGDYLGNVLLTWDSSDMLVSVDGDPILLTQEIPMHEGTAAKVAEWRTEFSVIGNRIVCETHDKFSADCSRPGPCPMADLITDAMISLRASAGTQLALLNSGTIRASFSPGNLTYADFSAALPFGDSLGELTLTGRMILDILEAGAAARNQLQRGNRTVNSFPRWAGLRYSVNTSKPEYQRISNEMIRNTTTGRFEPLDLKASYKLVTTGFVLRGGDNIIYPPVPDSTSVAELLECVVDHARKHSPISSVSDGRLIVIN